MDSEGTVGLRMEPSPPMMGDGGDGGGVGVGAGAAVVVVAGVGLGAGTGVGVGRLTVSSQEPITGMREM